MDKNKKYLVYNYSGSGVCVSTRYESIIIPGVIDGEPGSYLFTLEEIENIAATSPVFRYGLLWFEDDVKEEIYEDIRIRNWKDIMTDKDFENIILNPTAEGLNRILSIKEEPYFERAYGVYICLKNALQPISKKVELMFVARKKEFRDHIVTSEIKIVNDNLLKEPTLNDELDKAIKDKEEMAKELSDLKDLVKRLLEEKGEAKKTTKPKTSTSKSGSSKTTKSKSTKK